MSSRWGQVNSLPPDITALGHKWRGIFEFSPVPTLVVTGGSHPTDGGFGRIVEANGAARQLLAVLDQNPSSTRIGDLLDADDGDALIELLGNQLLTGGLPVALRQSAVGQDTERDFALHAQPLGDESGQIIIQLTPYDGWRAVERVQVEEQRFRSALLELSELAHVTKDDDEFYQRLIERAVEVVPGAQGGSVQLNIPGTAKFRFVAAVGYDLDGLQQHVLEQKQFFRDAWNPSAQIIRNFDAQGRSAEITEWLETVGRLSEITVNVSAPALFEGLPVAFLSLDNFEDDQAMTETSVEMTTVLSLLIAELWGRRRLEAEIRREREAYKHLALHDPLTGLANRRHLKRLLREQLEAVHAGHSSAVLFVDVDDFKGVNDRMGHKVGDQLLVEVAKCLERSVRGNDVVGRWGGDEFLIIPKHLASIEEAEELADRVIDGFKQELTLGGGFRYRSRVTVGVGWCTDSEAGIDRWVTTADQALYAAKAAGKGVARLLEV